MPHWTEIRPNHSYHMLILNRTSQIKANSLHMTDFILVGSRITVDGNCSHEIKRHMLFGRKTMTNLDGQLKSRDITLLTKVCIVKAMVFLVVHVWMWDLDHKEGWVLKNWCFTTEVLEKTLESLLDSKEIKPVNPKGNQPWILIGRTSVDLYSQLTDT